MHWLLIATLLAGLGGDRTPPLSDPAVPQVHVVGTESPNPQVLAGRMRMIDGRAAGILGQDDSNGDLALSEITISDSDMEAIADCGLAFFPAGRAFTKTGQWQIGRMKQHNPNFQFIIYFQAWHVQQGDPGLQRPMDQAIADLLSGYYVLDTSAQQVVAWRNDSNDIVAYWTMYTVGNATDGNFRFEPSIVDAQIDILAEEMGKYKYRPIGLKVDYLNTNSGGLYEYDIGQRDTIDADQDGTVFGSDADEILAYQAAQEYYLQQLKLRMGPQFLFMANGLGGFGDADDFIHGSYIEGSPDDNPFLTANNPDDIATDLWSHVLFNPHLTHPSWTGSGSIFMTDLRAIQVMGSNQAKINRALALLFDGFWRYRPYDSNNNVLSADLVDPVWDSWVAALGAPLLDCDRTTNGTQVIFTREFQGGTLVLTLEGANSGISQFVSVTIDGVAQ